MTHVGGDVHPYADLCPWCCAERAEARVKDLEEFKGIKAFRVNQCDVVAAHTPEEAVEWYKQEFGPDSWDVEDEIEEVPLLTMHWREGGNKASGRCSMRDCVYEEIGRKVANGQAFSPWVLSSTEF
jgi:hypothetical protein